MLPLLCNISIPEAVVMVDDDDDVPDARSHNFLSRYLSVRTAPSEKIYPSTRKINFIL